MSNKGYFIITDISGYTEFLTKSELEHAHKALQGLFNAQLARINFPLHISGFRGDAIFMYVPETDFINPQSLVEMIENVYIGFSEALQQMVLNNTCPCNACKNMPMLDLKASVHYGEYLVQKLGDKEELLGADVIVPHRMLKNHVIEKTGVKAYAIFSERAADMLGLTSLCSPLLRHTENYEHLGEVQIYVHNLKGAWENHLAGMRAAVDPETAWVRVEQEVPYPPALVWDYITLPAQEAILLGMESVTREDDLGGRTRAGAIIHCAHSSGDFFNKILDWKPFDYFTVEQSIAGDVRYFRTIRLDYDGASTKVGVYISKPEKEPPAGFRDYMEQVLRERYALMPSIIQADIDSGRVGLT